MVTEIPVPLTPPPPVAHVVTANPAPLGLFAFGMSLFVLSLHLIGAGVSPDGPEDIVISLAVFYGGICQVLTGMWEFRTGNTFGATTFTSYGAYWISYGFIYLPSSNIINDYGGQVDAFDHSLGLYMVGWALFTGLMLVAAHRSCLTLVAQFFMLFLTYVLTAAYKFNGSSATSMASGVCGLITAVLAFYNAMAGMLTPDNSFFILPIGRLP
ncbi:GPR1/FUN34/yaaH family-domain-containing protein [Absidia repens]|uniref:GPR1/FUN34/yaaH family-domain-containing protein n=1 Tax=Absidia repens TaxID=90262 RepID=A0A1X2IU73_9FUNG|nr:GPR1/FUN34/yaaH family-domain-containing protein [Absidia repens]